MAIIVYSQRKKKLFYDFFALIKPKNMMLINHVFFIPVIVSKHV